MFSLNYKDLLEIKPCGLGSRIRESGIWDCIGTFLTLELHQLLPTNNAEAQLHTMILIEMDFNLAT